MSSNKTSVTRTVQQVLRKDAREALRKEGIAEMYISDSETSDTEPVDRSVGWPAAGKIGIINNSAHQLGLSWGLG